jgi:hypothetical protein
MIVVALTGMPAAEEVIGPRDGEAHEILHDVANQLGIAPADELVHAVVRAGVQGASAGLMPRPWMWASPFVSPALELGPDSEPEQALANSPVTTSMATTVDRILTSLFSEYTIYVL